MVLSRVFRRQGAHQVAQKLTTSDLPLHAEMEMDLPVRSLSEKSATGPEREDAHGRFGGCTV